MWDECLRRVIERHQILPGSAVSILVAGQSPKRPRSLPAAAPAGHRVIHRSRGPALEIKPDRPQWCGALFATSYTHCGGSKDQRYRCVRVSESAATSACGPRGERKVAPATRVGLGRDAKQEKDEQHGEWKVHGP